MHYISYILGILVAGLLCLIWIHFASRSKGAASKSRLTLQRGGPGNATATERNARHILKRELRQTPVPWGWAHHQPVKNGDSQPAGMWAAVKAFVGRLTRRKELVSGISGNPHLRASLRALLEDRYTPLNHKPINSMPYRKVKPPLLRDPGAPHDQMDNFGSREAERVRQKLQHARTGNGRHGSPAGASGYRDTDLKNLKQPWGW